MLTKISPSVKTMAPSPISTLSANTNLYKAKRDFQRPTVLSKVSTTNSEVALDPAGR
jgi:hypothetical protein